MKLELEEVLKILQNEINESLDVPDNSRGFEIGFRSGIAKAEYIIQKAERESENTRANIHIDAASEQIRKNIEGCKIYGITIDMNNVNHLIVAAHEDGFMRLTKE